MDIKIFFFRLIKETLQEESSQHSSDSADGDDDDKQHDVPDKKDNRTNFHDSKLKIQQLDSIIRKLQKQSNRQRKCIKSLEETLIELKDKLNASNQALALLQDPEFDFDS